ncbi:unnamed protein product [Rhizophagus irregularis]|uniref:DUF659 domain-containing protein n=1 Tax=Rhizophagus irregularis TaxID=588596 RepID=A0A916EI75_9GLOM|nr:unnamed protein product [Rhizophagus irregularis]
MESIVSEPEPTVNQTNKRKQTTLNHYMNSFTKQDQEELESLLVRAFCTCPSFQIPSRHTLSGNLLNKEYKDLKKLVRNVFNETPYFCITSDGWSNINKAPIVNYMITTPKPIFYKSVYTKEEHHTGENIAKGIEECMISIGIDKFTAVITDNANNMKSAWRILTEKYADKIFLGCWAHGINSTLRRIQKEKYGYEVALTLTVETRWMSVFECLDHILKTKIAMRALLAEENIILNQEIKNYIINDCFWEELKNLCDFLGLFINFIRKLEGDEPYLSSAFVTLRDIENNILLNNKIPNDLVEYSIDRAKYR